MLPVNGQDVGNLFQALGNIVVCPAGRALHEQVINVLRTVFGCDAVSCERWGRRGARPADGAVATSAPAATATVLELMRPRHSLLAGGNLPLLTPLLLSACMTQQELLGSRLYRKHLRPTGALDHMLSILAGPAPLVVVGVHRAGWGFSKDEQEDMRSVVPNFATAFTRILRLEDSDRAADPAPPAAGAAGDDEICISTDFHGRITRCSDEGRALLCRYFPAQRDPAALPLPLMGVLSAGPTHTYQQVEFPGSASTLRMRVEVQVQNQAKNQVPPQAQRSTPTALLFFKECAQTALHSREIIGLPPRLQETLDWLGSGESIKAISTRLQVSEHTVRSYVRTLYQRLGVSNRGELLARYVNH